VKKEVPREGGEREIVASTVCQGNGILIAVDRVFVLLYKGMEINLFSLKDGEEGKREKGGACQSQD